MGYKEGNGWTTKRLTGDLTVTPTTTCKLTLNHAATDLSFSDTQLTGNSYTSGTTCRMAWLTLRHYMPLQLGNKTNRAGHWPLEKQFQSSSKAVPNLGLFPYKFSTYKLYTFVFVPNNNLPTYMFFVFFCVCVWYSWLFCSNLWTMSDLSMHYWAVVSEK